MKQKTSEMKRTDNPTCPPTETPKQTAPVSVTPPFSFTGDLPALAPNSILPIQSTQAESSSQIASTSATPAALDPFVQIKIDSLREKQRADSFFNSLPPEQRNKLVEWIIADDKNVIDLWRRVTKPVPEGLGIQVSLKTITRLRDAWRAEDLAAATSSSLDVLIDVAEQAGTDHAPRFQTAMNQILCEVAFEHMRTQPASHLLPEMLANIKKLTELELKRQKLQLEREKLLVKHTARPPAATNAEQLSVQHHRVDLNIVPQNGLPPRETVVIETEPQSPSQPLLPRPSEGRGLG